MERRTKQREGRLRGKYPEVHGKVVDFRLGRSVQAKTLWHMCRDYGTITLCIITLWNLSSWGKPATIRIC
jgi:hypothetical protein